MNIQPGNALMPVVPLKEMDAAQLVLEALCQTRALGWAEDEAARFEEAMRAAAFLHSGQYRRSRKGMPRTPYVEHPLRAALRLVRWGERSSDVLVAALMHDTVEDCAEAMARMVADVERLDESTLRTLATGWCRAVLGHGATRVVLAVTNPVGMAREGYLPHVEGLRGDRDALLVKAADLVDNAGSLRHQLGGPCGTTGEQVARLAAKYRPAVTAVAAMLGDLPGAEDDRVVTAAREHLLRVADMIQDL